MGSDEGVTIEPRPGEQSAALFERATRVIPGGVNSPVRTMRSVGREHPLFVQRGQGACVWDVDGNQYVDWVQSWGALPLGHADPEVVEAIECAARGGSSYGAPTAAEVELAELVCSAVPSIEQVRFVSSGTEALMSAIRVARAATGRDTIVTFAGCYHGHADAFLATSGSGMATLSIPSSPGVPVATAADTIVAPYNDIAATEQTIEQSGRPVAAIVVEPVAANMGVIAPAMGFLRGLRELCDRLGALLVFDEVITGFRLGWGGAQGRFGVQPDITTLGKVVGGGLPVGAFGGGADLMQLVAPVGSVYQAGTLSGNPLAMAAGLATLRALRGRHAYAQLEQLGEHARSALVDAVRASGAHVAVAQVGSLLTIFHLPDSTDRAPTNFADAQQLATERFARTHAGLLARGHLLPPSQYEALFVSLAHDASHIDQLADAVRESTSVPAGAPA